MNSKGSLTRLTETSSCMRRLSTLTLRTANPVGYSLNVSLVSKSMELFRSQHVCRNDPFVKFFAGEMTQLQRAFFQCRSFLVGIFRDRGSLIVSDMRIEGSDQH